MNFSKRTTTFWQLAAAIPVTVTIALLAIAIACVPSAERLLQFDRSKIAGGAIWRLATGHLTHWNMEHIQWDLLMFIVFGALCEMRNPRRMWACVIAAATSVSILVYVLFPGITAYRGLSGIDTALFTLLAVDLLRDVRQQQNRLLTFATDGLLLGFAAKTAYEAITGHAFFVDQQSAGFDLLVWDHVVAAIVGVLVALDVSQLEVARGTRTEPSATA